MSVSYAIELKWPDAIVAVRGSTLVLWQHPTLSRPTDNEIVNAVAEWEAAGSPVPQAVPQSVTKLQLVRALRAADLKDAFAAAMAAAPAEAQEDWGLAVEVLRSDPLVEQFGAGLGLTSGDIDALFIEAAGL